MEVHGNGRGTITGGRRINEAKFRYENRMFTFTLSTSTFRVGLKLSQMRMRNQRSCQAYVYSLSLANNLLVFIVRVIFVLPWRKSTALAPSFPLLAVLLRPVIHLALDNARRLGISSGCSAADGFTSLSPLKVLVLSSVLYDSF